MLVTDDEMLAAIAGCGSTGVAADLSGAAAAAALMTGKVTLGEETVAAPNCGAGADG